MEKKTLVMGVIGADVHAVGNKILYHAFTAAGFNCVNLGVMVSQEEYIMRRLSPMPTRLSSPPFTGMGNWIAAVCVKNATRPA